MAAAEILRLFDLYWFEHLVVVGKKPSPPPPPPLESKLSRPPTLHVRSMSSDDEYLFSSSDGSFKSMLSPDSVLQAPKLRTILSGKEVGEDSVDVREKVEERRRPAVVVERRKVHGGRIINRKKRELGGSKGLSDLEFEELKGFMDLGFVFSEEDKKSKLVSIVPGLQRLGKKSSGEEEEEGDDDVVSKTTPETAVSRPYLSEAWQVLERRRKELGAPVEELVPMVNWRISAAYGNEMDMKDHLRYWAHSVASAVR